MTGVPVAPDFMSLKIIALVTTAENLSSPLRQIPGPVLGQIAKSRNQFIGLTVDTVQATG